MGEMRDIRHAPIEAAERRIADLERAAEQKNDRIIALEREVERLKEREDQLEQALVDLESEKDHQFVNDLSKCRDALADAELDGRRLDWLDAHPNHMIECIAEIWTCLPETDSPDNYQGLTVREAIDAAIKMEAERE